MQKEQEQESPPAKDRRSRGATEPDPNREERTGEDDSTIGRSVQKEDRK